MELNRYRRRSRSRSGRWRRRGVSAAPAAVAADAGDAELGGEAEVFFQLDGVHALILVESG
jgi:hypothetical protein